MIGKYLNKRALRKYIDAHVMYRDDYPSRMSDVDFEDALYHEKSDYKTARSMNEFLLFNRLDNYKVTSQEEYHVLCFQSWSRVNQYL